MAVNKRPRQRQVTAQAGAALQIRRGQVARTLARSWRSLGQYHSYFDRWRKIYNCEHLLPEKLPPVEYLSIGIVRLILETGTD